jgi:hypothetical protein
MHTGIRRRSGNFRCRQRFFNRSTPYLSLSCVKSSSPRSWSHNVFSWRTFLLYLLGINLEIHEKFSVPELLLLHKQLFAAQGELDSLKEEKRIIPRLSRDFYKRVQEGVAIANQLAYNTRHNMSYQPDSDDVNVIRMKQISHGMHLYIPIRVISLYSSVKGSTRHRREL